MRVSASKRPGRSTRAARVPWLLSLSVAGRLEADGEESSDHRLGDVGLLLRQGDREAPLTGVGRSKAGGPSRRNDLTAKQMKRATVQLSELSASDSKRVQKDLDVFSRIKTSASPVDVDRRADAGEGLVGSVLAVPEQSIQALAPIPPVTPSEESREARRESESRSIQQEYAGR